MVIGDVRLGLCQCVAMLTRHSEQPDLWCAASPPLSLTISASAQARSGLCLKPAQYRPIRTKWWHRLTNQSPEYWGQLRPPHITAPSQSPAPSTAGRLADKSEADWELCQPMTAQCLWSGDWVVADWDGSQSVYTSDSRAQLEVTRSHQQSDTVITYLALGMKHSNMGLRTLIVVAHCDK